MNGESFLAAHLPRPGIAAAGILAPGGGVTSRCDDLSMSTAQIENAVGRLARAAEALRRARVQGSRLCWTFERVRIHCAQRGDGALLVLFLPRSGPSGESDARAILRAFGTAA